MKQQLVLLLFIVFVGCKNNQHKTDLQLSTSQFTNVLKDLHFYEGKIEQRILHSDSMFVEIHNGYDSIFQAHAIEKSDFSNDYNLYVTQFPTELDSIYQTVINELEELEDSLQLVRQESKRNTINKKDDSLQVDEQLRRIEQR